MVLGYEPKMKMKYVTRKTFDWIVENGDKIEDSGKF